MRKTIIIPIPLRSDIQKKQYESNNSYIQVSDIYTHFPLISYLDLALTEDDELTVILLLKTSGFDNSENNAQLFLNELSQITNRLNITPNIIKITENFEVNSEIYERTVNNLVKNIEDNSLIITDITYGPKEMPILIFTALQIAKKYLHCEIDNIFYGLGYFDNTGELKETRLCDIGTLFSMLDLLDTMKPSSSELTRKLVEKISLL